MKTQKIDLHHFPLELQTSKVADLSHFSPDFQTSQYQLGPTSAIRTISMSAKRGKKNEIKI